MFDATRSNVSGVNFEQLDVSEPGAHQDEKAKYGVHGIPCVVFLDGSGNVLFSGGPVRSVEGFTQQIQQFQ